MLPSPSNRFRPAALTPVLLVLPDRLQAIYRQRIRPHLPGGKSTAQEPR